MGYLEEIMFRVGDKVLFGDYQEILSVTEVSEIYPGKKVVNLRFMSSPDKWTDYVNVDYEDIKLYVDPWEIWKRLNGFKTTT